jgi:hypothetical protein
MGNNKYLSLLNLAAGTTMSSDNDSGSDSGCSDTDDDGSWQGTFPVQSLKVLMSFHLYLHVVLKLFNGTVWDVNNFHSDNADNEAGEGSSGAAGVKKKSRAIGHTRMKGKGDMLRAPPARQVGFPNNWAPDSNSLPAGPYHGWPWMQAPQMQPPPGPWMLPLAPGTMLPWGMPPVTAPMQYPAPSWAPNAAVDTFGCRVSNPESVDRARRRLKRKHGEDVEAQHASAGQKAKQIRVKVGGEIDGACPRKNGWDDGVRSLVPRLLDISIVDWEGQNQDAVQHLRDRLDSEFEYLGNPLSMQGFRNSVKRYLKSERSRLKGRYKGGDSKNPMHVQPAQWERLKTYWWTEKQVLKSATMQDARSKVKHVSVVGRKSKAGLEALAVTLLTFRFQVLYESVEKHFQFLANACSFFYL